MSTNKERRIIILDVETGDWLPGSSSIIGDDGVRLACSVLPGMDRDVLAKAYADHMNSDGEPTALEAAEAELLDWASGGRSHWNDLHGSVTGDYVGMFAATATADAAKINQLIAQVAGLRLLEGVSA